MKIEIRRWECTYCKERFWVDCDDDEYPNYCPNCGQENFDMHGMTFIPSSKIVIVNAETEV